MLYKMKVEQIYELVNATTREVLGEDVVLQQDLSNVVDVGEAIIGSDAVDNYVKSLVNHIGRVKFVDRVYKGNAPSVLMEAWEFGSILEKIQAELPDAVENLSWELEDGRSYDPNVFNKPEVSAKFFNSKSTFEIELSFTEMQVKESFSSAEQLNGFISMLTNEVDKSLTIKMDGLIKSTVASAMADTLHDGKPTQAINLAQAYYEDTGKTITLDRVKTDKDFIRYAVLKMKDIQSKISNASRVFNRGGKVRFTDDANLHVLMLDEFKSAADIYLYSDIFHKEMAALPNAETMPFWQGTGTDYSLQSTSKINVISGEGHAVEQAGILAVMFDREALGVTNQDKRVKTHYNPKGEFFNYFYKQDAGFFTDGDENLVVFYVGDVTPAEPEEPEEPEEPAGE